MPYLRLLRPEQWTKNLFLFAGLIFGQKLFDLPSVILAVLGFFCFSFVSSAVYIVNDIHDRAEDRLHPKKKNRPIAAGQVSIAAAILMGVLLLVGGLGSSYLLNRGLFLVAGTYFLLQLTYTFWLKHAAILDVILIGIGFVLRAVAGAVLVGVNVSHWLVLCTFTLCLFMGFSKRRCELDALAEMTRADVARHRRTLVAYTPELLNHMTTLTAAIAVVCFILYATDKRTLAEFGTNYLVYTLPMVVYAIFRFALLVEHGRVSGPTQVLTHDRPFQAAMALWVLAALIVVYYGRTLQHWFGHVVTPTTM